MKIAITFDIERDWYRVLGCSKDEYKEKTYRMIEYAMPRLLEAAEEYSIPYTLFLCGEVAEAVPYLFEGLPVRHQLGVHTHPFTHPGLFRGTGPNDHDADLLRQYTYAEQREMIARDRALIQDALGASPDAFRAGKHGADATTLQALDSLGFAIDASADRGYQLVGWKPYRIDGTGIVEIPTYCVAGPEILEQVERLLLASRRFDRFSNVYSIVFHPMVFGNPNANREKHLVRYAEWIEKGIKNDFDFLTLRSCAGDAVGGASNLLGHLIGLGMLPIRYFMRYYGDLRGE